MVILNEEFYISNIFELDTAGFINNEGEFVVVDDGHYSERDLLKNKWPEFSNTHSEEDTCIRIYKEPNSIQYEKLEEIINKYLEQEGYCKVEIYKKDSQIFSFYKCFSLYENACAYPMIEEIVGNWTGYKLIKIIKNHFKNNLNEELLLEVNRNQLINKSKKSDPYKDQSKGKNRWERRNHSKIDRRVDQYNKIDMNSFFKKDELKVGINVHGETDDYVVTIRFNKALKAIHDEIKRNKDKFEFKCVLIALQRTFNNGDVFVSCTCPDWKYRQSYFSTKDGYNSGTPEIRASNITNPHDTKGGGCKHVNLVIGNIDWVMKIASVINNYIHYMKEHYERLYADVIFPKLFDFPYNKAIQLNLFDDGNNKLKDDSEEIKLSNSYGRNRGKFRSDIKVNNMKNFKGDQQENKGNEGPFLQQNISK